MRNLSKTITTKNNRVVIKSFSEKMPGLDGFTGKFFQTFNNKVAPMIFKLFQNPEKDRKPSSIF